MKPNKEQFEAIKYDKGPLLIIAGAGTGKTTVITERIKHLMGKGVEPEEILALTFTEKAAREMEDRVDRTLPLGYTQMQISTFHSFCDKVLREEAFHIGLDPSFNLLTTTETLKLIRDNSFEFDLKYFLPLGNPNKFIGGLLQHFSRLQDEDISPKEYEKWAKKEESKINNSKKTDEEKEEVEKWLELSRAYKKYDELKIKNGVMDFGDLITKTLMLFRKRKSVLKKYTDKFKHVLVDEFQDVNFAQNQLAILLAEKNITVTGDDDQSIYRFRGAAISNIIQFRLTFPKAKVVVLTKNYRSRQGVLDTAYKLIQNNNPNRLEVVEKINKKLIAQKNKKSEIGFIYENGVLDEAEEVAKKINSLVSETRSPKSDNYTYGDIAILVRANAHAEVFSRALSRHGIPFQFLGPAKLFKEEEVVDLISYLKILSDPDDSFSLYRFLSSDFLDIPNIDLIRISNFSKRKNISLFEVLGDLSKVNISQKSEKIIQKIFNILSSHINDAKKTSPGELLYKFLVDSGLLKKLINPEKEVSESVAKNIAKFFDKVKSFENTRENIKVADLVDWLDLASEVGESPLVDSEWQEVDAVNILTVHSAKGLEFPVVFLVNLVVGRFPSVRRSDQIPLPENIVKEIPVVGDFHLQEERRLFYVGLTRAMDKIFLSAAKFYGEGKRIAKISPFVYEAVGDIDLEVKMKPEVLLKELPEKSSVRASSRLKIDTLSYSQIQAFEVCPLHYKLRYVLRLPTVSTSALSFGTSIHETLRSFYARLQIGEKTSLSLLYRLLAENWVNEGYKNKKHEEQMLVKAKKQLKGFYEKFDRKVTPLATELPFKIKIGRADNPLKLVGKIDRVDSLSENRFEIIDYKTGEKVPTQREVDKDLQLTFYALALSKINLGKDKKVEDIVLSLYYLDENKKISTTRTKEQLKEVEEKILDIRKQIESSDFKCSKNYFCKNCEFSLMCEG